ncbi:hypothetical protein Pelo_19145 [Pelomyxa schiedti]|nr:hypothetical protein Pelo_19145 [Pelomyxa schiedti]
MFLADIGTIVHFRYPSWYRTELHNLVILEPRSFWLALTVHYNWFLSGRKVFFHDLTPPLALALREIADHQSYRQPEQSVFNTYGCLSFLPIPSQTCGKLEEFKATGHTAPTSVTGRLLKFPVFPQELFVKAMSTLWSLIFWGWTLECRREGAFLLAHSCSHSRKAHLFITCQDAIVSLYMQEECDNADCWPLKKRADLWANLMSTFSDLGKSVYARFEEKSGSYLPATVELFPCTACLKYWDSCPEKWFHSDRPTAFPPTLSCFTRDKIFNAVKNGVEQLTCRNRSGAVDIDRMAPDIVELHQAATEFASKSPTPAPTPTFLSLSNPIINIALGDLLSLLIEKGNGTT